MNIKQPVVVIGIGQLGGVFARGFLSAGYPVYPVIRGMNMEDVVKNAPSPCFVLVAVSENVLHKVLERMPEIWKDKLVLLQNELLPHDWEDENIIDPTVMAVWFEKKRGMGIHVFKSTPIYGPYALNVESALKTIDIPTKIVSEKKGLLNELVKKNLYVYTINIAGLKVGGTVGQLWLNHQELVKKVAHDVLNVQEKLTNEKFDRDAMIASMVRTFGKAPDHKCAGRVAKDRLNRILCYADDKKVSIDTLKEISMEMEISSFKKQIPHKSQ